MRLAMCGWSTDYAEPGKPPVRLFVHGGGHVVPGEKNAPRIMGQTVRSIRTVDEIGEFLGMAR